MTVWFSFGELLTPVTFSDKSSSPSLSVVSSAVEGYLSPADFHPSLVPWLDLSMCYVEGKLKLTQIMFCLCWLYHVILHSAWIVFCIVCMSNFIWKATVVLRISHSKAILYYILWCKQQPLKNSGENSSTVSAKQSPTDCLSQAILQHFSLHSDVSLRWRFWC